MNVKQVLSPLFFATVLFLSGGCTSFKRLTGDTDEKTKDPANVQGVWSGPIQLDGRSQTFGLIIDQSKTNLSGVQDIEYTGTMDANISGSVGERDIHLLIDEGTRCVNKFNLDGEVSGNTMTVRITGAGNNIPGTTCYPTAIDQVIVLDGNYRGR